MTVEGAVHIVTVARLAGAHAEFARVNLSQDWVKVSAAHALEVDQLLHWLIFDASEHERAALILNLPKLDWLDE